MRYARFAGHCHVCGDDINAGEAVRWSDTHRKLLVHVGCKPPVDTALPIEVQDELERTFLRGEYYPDPIL